MNLDGRTVKDNEVWYLIKREEIQVALFFTWEPTEVFSIKFHRDDAEESVICRRSELINSIWVADKRI